MRISPVYNNIIFQGKLPQAKQTQSAPAANYTTLPNGINGQAKIQLDALKQLKEETKEFPKDIEYRKNLLANAGLNPNEYYKLRPIVGSQEIQSIMKAYDSSEAFYNVGKNDENLKSGFFRGNLHIHTQASDGNLTVEELLDKAAEYANSVVKKQPQFKKEPFTIAITDHDTTESAQKAIQIIAKDPLKYKNLRVILGTEMTTYNDIAPELLNAPMSTHVLAYGIDPNEKTYKNFIQTTKDLKNKAAQSMIDDANALGKEIFDLNEAKRLLNSINKNILGICKHMGSYMETKYIVSEIICKNDELKAILKEKNLPTNADDLMKTLSNYAKEKYGNNKPLKPLEEFPLFLKDEKAYELILKEIEKPEHKEFLAKISNSNANYLETFAHNEKVKFLPKFDDLYNGLKDQDNAIIGLAHPLKNAFKLSTAEDKIKFLTDFYTKFKAACKEKAKFSEVYYQSYADPVEAQVTNFLNQISKIMKLFRTGSADSHGKNIFKRI